MKTVSATACFVAALTLAASSASAAIYTDAVGDFTGGPADLDISSVSVNNDASTLTFTISLAGNPSSQNWYNFYVGISRNLYGGVGGNLNAAGGWGKDVQMSAGGMDYFIGAYPSFAGYSLLTWAPSSWTSTGGTASQNSTSVTIPVALSSLGLNPGDSFMFDVWTSTTGGDVVLDALSDGVSRTWNSNPWNTGGNALAYTVQVPELGSLALLTLGGLLVLRQARKRFQAGSV